MRPLPRRTPSATIDEREDSQPGIRFIDATPSAQLGRKETRALIRAHASKFSWARLKIQKHRLQSDSKASGPSGGRPPESEQSQTKQKARRQSRGYNLGRQNSSESVPDFLDGHGSESFLEVNPSTSMQSLPLVAEVGVDLLDPFESYPSSLPRAAVSHLFDQGQYLNDILSSCAARCTVASSSPSCCASLSSINRCAMVPGLCRLGLA